MPQSAVTSVQPIEPVPEIRAWELLAPRVEGQINPFALPLRGFVAGARSPAVGVELRHGSARVASLPLGVRQAARQVVQRATPAERPLLQSRIAALRALARLGGPGLAQGALLRRVLKPDVLYGGFDGTVPLLGLPPRCTLTLFATLADGRSRPLATIQIDRPPLRVSATPRYQPLMVTSIGRSGSTWVQHLLAQHPAVAAFRAHAYEATVARELAHLAAGAAARGPYTEAFFRKKEFQSEFTGPGGAEALEGLVHAVEEGVADLAAGAVRAIDRMYALADGMSGRPPAGDGGPRYFTEKNLQPEWLFWEAYPRAKEIFLVRDFRDVICSSLAANAKWGKRFFGRGAVASDLEYVHHRAAMARPWILEPWRDRAGRAFLLRYEELILEPERTLAGVLEYLELDADPATVRRMLQGAQDSQNADKRARHMTSDNPAASIGRWKSDLSPELARACDEAFAEFFAAFYGDGGPAGHGDAGLRAG